MQTSTIHLYEMLDRRPLCTSLTLSDCLTVLVAALSSKSDSRLAGQQVSFRYESQNFSEKLVPESQPQPPLHPNLLISILILSIHLSPSGHQMTGYALLLKAASHEFQGSE